MPQEIEDLTQRIQSLEKRMEDPTFYQKDPEGFDKVIAELQDLRHCITEKEERLIALLIKEEELQKG